MSIISGGARVSVARGALDIECHDAAALNAATLPMTETIPLTQDQRFDLAKRLLAENGLVLK